MRISNLDYHLAKTYMSRRSDPTSPEIIEQGKNKRTTRGSKGEPKNYLSVDAVIECKLS